MPVFKTTGSMYLENKKSIISELSLAKVILISDSGFPSGWLVSGLFLAELLSRTKHRVLLHQHGVRQPSRLCYKKSLFHLPNLFSFCLLSRVDRLQWFVDNRHFINICSFISLLQLPSQTTDWVA